MSISHLLEDFETNLHAGSKRMVLSDIQLEEFRLAAFESGYAAGWDDAISNQRSAQADAIETLTKRIEDLSYTFIEARAEMLAAVEPVFKALLDQVLPENTDVILAAALLDRLKEASKDRAGNSLDLVVPSGCAQFLSHAVTEQGGLKVLLVENAELSPEKATIKLHSHEEEIDLGELSAALREAIEATFFEIKQELKHG